MDKIDALCRVLKQFRDSGSPKLAGMSDADLVGLAWTIYEAGERERPEKAGETSRSNSNMQYPQTPKSNRPWR